METDNPVDDACGASSIGRLTRINRSQPTSPHDRDDRIAATRELPTSGYGLEVDGRLKAEFVTRDGARTGGAELKKRFPMLQIDNRSRRCTRSRVPPSASLLATT